MNPRILSFVPLVLVVSCDGSREVQVGPGESGAADLIKLALPDSITLPTGFRPEGIAISGNQLFTGSIPTGRIFRADLFTGAGQVIVEPPAGRSAIGMKVDEKGLLFVAGGQTGKAFVYDAETGADVAQYTLAEGNTFINDVVLTRHAAVFTDSRNPTLFRVPIGKDGKLCPQAKVTPLPLSGDFQFVAGQNNANGIISAEGSGALVIVQSATGKLFKVDAETGATKEIDLQGETMTNGDGLLLDGSRLLVVQNRKNQVAVVKLSDNLLEGTVEQLLTSPAFDVPSTVAAIDDSLYLPNARFGIPDPDNAEYNVVRIDRP